MSTSENLHFRAAERRDLIAIAGLLTQLNRVEGNGITTNSAELARGLFDEGQPVHLRALLAEQKKQIVGIALYYTGYDVLSATPGYHLGDLVIDETARRKGIGRALVAQLAQQNLAQGGQWMALTVLQTNDPARAFYASLGMQPMPVEFMAIGPVGLKKLETT